MKTIKYLLKRYTPEWVMFIGFLVAMIALQIGQNISDWGKKL